MNGLTFGTFISVKRRECGLTLKKVASHLGITSAYLCDIEKGNRNAFDPEKLRKFALMTDLNEDEKALMYDLAGENRGEISPDVSQYIRDNAYICASLRKAKTLKANRDDWEKMLEELKKRKDEENVLY